MSFLLDGNPLWASSSKWVAVVTLTGEWWGCPLIRMWVSSSSQGSESFLLSVHPILDFRLTWHPPQPSHGIAGRDGHCLCLSIEELGPLNPSAGRGTIFLVFWVTVRSCSLPQYLTGEKTLMVQETSTISYWNLPSEGWGNNVLYILTPFRYHRLPINCIPLTMGLPLWSAGLGHSVTNKDWVFFFFIQTWILLKIKKVLWLQYCVWISECCHYNVWSLGRPTRGGFVFWPLWGCLPTRDI